MEECVECNEEIEKGQESDFDSELCRPCDEAGDQKVGTTPSPKAGSMADKYFSTPEDVRKMMGKRARAR